MAVLFLFFFHFKAYRYNPCHIATYHFNQCIDFITLCPRICTNIFICIFYNTSCVHYAFWTYSLGSSCIAMTNLSIWPFCKLQINTLPISYVILLLLLIIIVTIVRPHLPPFLRVKLCGGIDETRKRFRLLSNTAKFSRLI